MQKQVRFLGLDVMPRRRVARRKPTAKCAAWSDPNRGESIRKLVKRLGQRKHCGPATRLVRRVVLYWQLTELGWSA